MKRVNIIAAAIAAVFAINTTVFAGYYKRADIEPFDGTSIAYEPYDEADTDKLIAGIRANIGEPGHEAELRKQLGALVGEFVKARYSATAANLIADRYYNEENLGNYTAAAEVQINITEKITDVMKEIYDSQYRSILCEVLLSDNEELEEFINSIPSERYYELARQEEELVTRYGELYGDSDACAELYIELVALRNEMAAAEGYDNYAEFAQAEVYARDYDKDELEVFYDSVAEHLTPLWQAVFFSGYELENRYTPQASDQELIAKVGSVMSGINDELGSAFSFMIDNNLYDIELREGKNPSSGSYTVTLDAKGVPYLFISDAEDSAWHVKNLIHEGGHFCAILNTPELDDEWLSFVSSMSIDTCEIHSQALELLAEYYYGKLFGDDAAYERYATTALIIENVIDGCYFNEWQTRVYEEKNLTVDRANELAAELVGKYYGVPDFSKTAAQEMWTSVHHNYVSPMYYISYAVSAAAALDIYAMSFDDYAAAVDKYMRLTALGGYATFREVLGEVGLPDIFEPETITYISQEIGAELGIAYIDVDYEAWYAPYIYETSHIADGRAELFFEPDAPITRAEFVRLIGKMYDYYEGIDGTYTLGFKDVDPSDESAVYIMWANANGIIEGYTDTEFGPDDEITREQLAAILCRLDSPAAGASSVAELGKFPDGGTVSDWAEAPVLWAIGSGLIEGRGDEGYIAPQGSTTRAEAITIAARYIELSY